MTASSPSGSLNGATKMSAPVARAALTAPEAREVSGEVSRHALMNWGNEVLAR
jgi:hypothetical protein